MRTTKCRRCAALEVLGLGKNPTNEEIKKAHRLLSKVWHPDRFAHDASMQDTVGKKFADINAARDDLDNLSPRCQCVEEEPPPDRAPDRPEEPPINPKDVDETFWEFSDEEIRQKEARTRKPDHTVKPEIRTPVKRRVSIFAVLIVGSIAAWLAFMHRLDFVTAFRPAQILACRTFDTKTCVCPSPNETVFQPSYVMYLMVVTPQQHSGRVTMTFANGLEHSVELRSSPRQPPQTCEVYMYRIPKLAGSGVAQMRFTYLQGTTQKILSTTFRVGSASKAPARIKQNKPATLPQQAALPPDPPLPQKQ